MSLADRGVIGSISRAGNVWDNGLTESLFASLKTEGAITKMHRTRAQGKADVLDDIEPFYDLRRWHSTWGISVQWGWK